MTERPDPTTPALPDAEAVEAALDVQELELPEEAVADTPAELGTLEVEMERGVLLSARAVTKRFGGLLAVNAIDFDIPEGSIVCADRAERRRQDDVLQRHRRDLRSDRRARRLPWPPDDRPDRQGLARAHPVVHARR